MRKTIIIITTILMFVFSGCSQLVPKASHPAEYQQTTEPFLPSEETAPSITSEPDNTVDVESYENAINLPILDEIDRNTRVATAGAYSTAIKSAESLLDWGCNTGLGADEIRAGAEKWKHTHDEETLELFYEKLRTVDDAYQLLIGVIGAEEDQRDDGAWAWGRERVEAIEIVMEVFGLR